jgi:hypothetical protein
LENFAQSPLWSSCGFSLLWKCWGDLDYAKFSATAWWLRMASAARFRCPILPMTAY